MVNMQMAFLSPPFGYSLFYLKSVAPPRNQHGDDFPRGREFHGAAMARRGTLHRLSANRDLVAAIALRNQRLEAALDAHHPYKG